MKQVLTAIQDGSFAREWIAEMDKGSPSLAEDRSKLAETEIEQVGCAAARARGARGHGGAWRRLTSRSPCSGYGTVGSAVNRLLNEQADDIERATGHRLRRRQGARPRPEQGARLRARRRRADDRTSDEILGDPAIAIVAEVMGGVEPTGDYVLQALRSGKHVVTANKQLVARRGAELFARRLRRRACSCASRRASARRSR